MLILWLDCC